MKNIFSKKSLAFFITALMIFSSIAVIASADTTVLDVWDGTIATGYAGGTGTEEDPYLISTPEQLALMSIGTNYVNAESKYYKLTADIYLNDTTKTNWKENSPKEWLKTKTDSNYFFNGNFDGAGHTIYGLYASGNFERMGLFPGVVGTVSFKNLVISDSYFCGINTAGKYIGGLLGFIYRDASSVTMENCYVSDTVTIIGEHSVAGFIGYGNCASINFKNCASFASVTNRSTQYTRYGSFVGALAGGTRKVNYNGCIGNLAYTTYVQYPTYTASYCAVEGTVDSNTSNKTYPTVVALEDMVGAAAKTNMPGLDWTGTWATTDGFPVFKSMLPEAPACDHTNKKDANVVAATYFKAGLKNIVCADDACGAMVETDVVIPASEAALNGDFTETFADGKLTISWTYSDALALDILDGAKISFNYSINGYTKAVELSGETGETVILEGFNADRLNADLTYNLSAIYGDVDTAKLNAVGGTVKTADIANDEKLDALLEALEADAVVNGKAENTKWLVSNIAKLNLKAAKAELNVAASQELIDALAAKGGRTDRAVKLIVKIGDDFTKEFEINDLRKYTIVTISGLSFEQLNGDISVQLVFDYANNEYDFATDEIVFACGDMIANADTAAANAFAAYMSK